MNWTTTTAHYAVEPYMLWSRYLAGGVSLRAARTTTRREFFMRSCLAAPCNAVVTDLVAAVNRYNETVKYLARSILSVRDICDANRVLSQHDSNTPGVIRHTPFIHNIKKNKIALPAPDETENYLNKALGQLHTSGIEPLQAAVYVASNLLWLHPFAEGNGRTARALFDAIALKNNVLAISPFFFIFQQKNMQQHLNAVVLTASTQGFNISGEFWQQYALWHTGISALVTALLKGTHQTFNSKLLMLPLGAGDVEKINSLWRNPIINPNMQSVAPQLLSTLLQTGMLSVKRTPVGVVYVCDFILAMYEQLDELLLSGKE